MSGFNTRYEKPPSQAVLDARARRLARAINVEIKTEWFISEVMDKINTTLNKRVKIATELVRSKVTINISRPVTKAYWSRNVQVIDAKGNIKNKTEYGVDISNRSKSGEYPKADTVQLLRTIFGTVIETSPGVFSGYVGTPLLYGLVLELRMNRSFLARTLHEEYTRVMRILTGPIG